MINKRMMSIERLRERALQCRQLATHAQSRGIAAELESLASEYDRDADGLESFGQDDTRSVSQ